MWVHVPSTCCRSAPEWEPSTWDCELLYRSLEQFASWRGKYIAAARWSRECRKNFWMTRLCGWICEPSMAHLGVERWIASLQESHAPRSPTQANEKEGTTQTGSGLMCGESFASLDQSGSFWKTCEPSCPRDIRRYSAKSSPTWPATGLMLRGTCFRLASLVPHIHGPECSLWPTPTATDSCGRGYHKSGGRVYLALPGAIQVAAGKHYQNPDTGKTNPEWVEWLMGWPIGWTDCEQSATESFQTWWLSRGLSLSTCC